MGIGKKIIKPAATRRWRIEGYKTIQEFPDYAINACGKVISRITKQVVDMKRSSSMQWFYRLIDTAGKERGVLARQLVYKTHVDPEYKGAVHSLDNKADSLCVEDLKPEK
jgi:hypothetical protein